MTKAVLTSSPGSIYDDLPEERYHFPRTYLRQMEAAVGDWVIYYEPRRDSGLSSSGGRQAYFAVARVDSILPDPNKKDHYYAEISHFLEFDHPVPFKDGNHYYESLLKRSDGGTNKGAFGRAVRELPEEEYELILQAGFTRELAPWEEADADILQGEDRPIYDQLVRRPFRDQKFRHRVRQVYDNTCAVTGLKLLNGGGRPEVQAAHIRPVEKQGPDSVRNGLALTATVHWLFDRGLISLDDDYRVLVAEKSLPTGMKDLVVPKKEIALPDNEAALPHPAFLRWHREHIFHD